MRGWLKVVVVAAAAHLDARPLGASSLPPDSLGSLLRLKPSRFDGQEPPGGVRDVLCAPLVFPSVTVV